MVVFSLGVLAHKGGGKREYRRAIVVLPVAAGIHKGVPLCTSLQDAPMIAIPIQQLFA